MISNVFPATPRNRWAGRLAATIALAVVGGIGCGDSEHGGLAPEGGSAPPPPQASQTQVASPGEAVEQIEAGRAPSNPPAGQHRADRSRRNAVERAEIDPSAPVGTGAEDALFNAMERMERRVASAMVRVRESVIALEYTAADSPTGARRVATGVVINPQGEILSIRIDRPPSPPASLKGDGAQGSRPFPGREPKRNAAAPIVARDAGGRRHTASWVAADPETGLTLLRIAPKLVRPVRIALSLPKLGSSVFVVGNPFGLGQSVSRGHVAGLDRALELGPRQLGGLTQVQVPLYPGDSGATVANLRGEWLGLIRGGLAANPGPAQAQSPSASASSSQGPRKGDDDPDRDAEMDHDHDIGFAIPARDAIWIADQLRSSGRVDRAYLGVRLESADASATDVPGVEGAGLSEILADSPAAGAGLRAGDRIVALDAHPIRSPADLTDRLDRTRANTEIKLGVSRPRPPRVAAGPDGREGQEIGSRERLDITLRAASRPASSAPSADAGPASPEPGLSPGEIQAAGIDPGKVVRAVVSKTSASTSSSASGPSAKDPGGASDPKAVPLRPATVAKPSTSESIPAQRPLPLESRAVPPRPAELEPISPRAVIDRLERLERRLDRLERRDAPAAPPSSRNPATGSVKSRD